MCLILPLYVWLVKQKSPSSLPPYVFAKFSGWGGGGGWPGRGWAEGAQGVGGGG